MVFEDLIGPTYAKRHPTKLFFFGVVFALLAIAFGLWIFPTESSMVVVFLVVIMTIPLTYVTLVQEEAEEFVSNKEVWLLREHGRVVRFFMYLFLGLIVGFSLFYVFSSNAMVQKVFSLQLSTIESINNPVSGGAFVSQAFFSILTNNLKVLFFCLLFAVFFGAGAIFILAWNASVISAAIGTYVRNGIAEYASLLGFNSVAIHFNLFVAGILRYMLHGVFEIAAYFIAGLAGGIMSVALINDSVRIMRLKRVIKDTTILIAIAIILIVFGALVEVFVTPVFFK
ncbi:stage II sporulation protein M [Candidatus Woesearchaeota archaeon]|nr:stage II sporulation protein M [Candidatus Woesearchaeota archaeon]